MTYFEIIKSALDQLINGVCAHARTSRERAMVMADAVLSNMSQEWFNGDRPTIAYGDPLCRFCYLYAHTAVNANIFDKFVQSHRPTMDYILSKMNEDEELRVCAFGGGPGTELLALSKLFARARRFEKLTGHGEIRFTILDTTAEWAESWDTLNDAIRDRLRDDYGTRRDWPFTISRNFQPFDMTDVGQFANLAQLLRQDLYVMNYVVSEVLGEESGLGNVIRLMAQNAPQGARFIIVDRDQNGIKETAQRLLTEAGLEIESATTSSTNMDYDEQASDLGDYYNAIVREPRVQWSGAFGLIAVKP